MFKGDRLVGAGSLIRYQSGNLSRTGAWLSNIYIAPDRRNKGYGNALVESLENIARQRGLLHLNLYTLDKRAFYARRGWLWQYKARISGRDVDVMQLSLPRLSSD